MIKVIKNLILFGLIFLLLSSSFSKGETYDLTGTIELQYTVEDSNESTGYWSNYPHPGGYYYDIPVQSLVNVSYVNFEIRSSSFDLEIGNLTLTDINETLVQDNLAFGYWSLANTFGFRSTAQWEQIKTDLSSVDGLTSSVVTEEATYLGNTLSVVNITIIDAYQTSNLIYEQDNGLLLYGYSNVFGFLVELSILSINGDADYFAKFGSNSDTSPFILSFVFLGMFVFVTLRHRKI